MVRKDLSNVVMTVEEFLKDAKPCDLFKKVNRELQVADLKEIYSEKYLLESGLVTKEEYDTIPASTSRATQLRRMQDEAELRHQVIGAEAPPRYSNSNIF